MRALNTKFGLEELQLSASVDGTGIKITTTGYGSSARFDVDWGDGNYTNYAGLDVQGTIGGVTATGNGQQLSIPFDNSEMGGLALSITATAIGSLGTFGYQPGVGARTVTSLLDATDVLTGYITSTEKALKARVSFIDTQVESMERRLEQYQTRLKAYYAQLETTLSTLQQQSQWLAGQVAGLNAQQ